jgi:hypothetical protein
MAAFDAEIRQPLIEIENRWPGQRVAIDLPHIPDGFFVPDGLRSLPIWFREVLCAAEQGLFEADDPVRQRIADMKAQGSVNIRYPSRPMWG